jgi:hypothetical protein
MREGQNNPSCDAQSRPSQLGDARPQQPVRGTKTEFYHTRPKQDFATFLTGC